MREKNRGIAVNPIGTKVICFSRFFYAFLCLCCLQTHVRVVCFVCVGSWSFGVGIALCLSFWIPNFVRKVLKSFENKIDWLGNRTSGSLGLVCRNGSLGTLHCFYWFLVIQS